MHKFKQRVGSWASRAYQDPPKRLEDAITASRMSIVRLRMMKFGARLNPPQAASGGFPYFGGGNG